MCVERARLEALPPGRAAELLAEPRAHRHLAAGEAESPSPPISAG